MGFFYFVSIILLYTRNGAGMNISSADLDEFLVEITNGVEVNEMDIIYAVSIRVDKHHECGGSIIAFQWVLTAGHCIIDNERYTVLYGTLKSYDGEDAPSSNTRNGVYKHIYPAYKKNPVSFYDVGLLMVNAPFEFNSHVHSVTLPEAFEAISYKPRVLLQGWGYLQPTSTTMAEKLHKIRIPIYPKLECDMYPGIGLTQFCAGGIDGGGVCLGDSGSPLISGEVQLGVSSWGYLPCGNAPGVFEAVSSYVRWINLIIN